MALGFPCSHCKDVKHGISGEKHVGYRLGQPGTWYICIRNHHTFVPAVLPDVKTDSERRPRGDSV